MEEEGIEKSSLDWKRSFRLDLLRSLPQGVVDTVAMTFAVFLAVRVFDGSALMKMALVSAPSYGLLASIFVVPLVKRSQVTANRAVAFFWGLAAMGFFVASIGTHQWAFVVGLVIALISLMLGLPLISQLYRTLYPGKTRGRLFARAAMARAASAVIAAYCIGVYLEPDPSGYPVIMALCSAMCIGMILCVLYLPAVRLPVSEKTNILGAFRHVKKDKEFRDLLISWMFLGTGNLMSAALFVEFVSNPIHGYGFGSEKVSLITTVLPSVLFLCTVVVWGSVFDRWNFYLVRSSLNVCFAAGIGVYFLGGGEWALWLGLGLHGFSRGGANVAWSLWVTKFSTKDHVAEYMSVHTFLTGCRGVLAPVFAFTIIEVYSPQTVAIIGVSLILFATALIAPKVRFAKPRRVGEQQERRPIL